MSIENSQTSLRYDVLIVGGGLVGACLAYYLRKMDFNIGLIEQKELLSNSTLINHNFDDRSIVLTYPSILILQAVELWSALEEYAYPIEKVYVSKQSSFGTLRFNASDYHIPFLGCVVPAAILTATIQRAMLGSNIKLFSPATINELQKKDETVQIKIFYQGQEQLLESSLLVGADGAQSQIRELQKVKTQIYDYQQNAIVAVINTSLSHQQIAYERMTEIGPLALLPRGEKTCGLIWTMTNRKVQNIFALSDKDFIEKIQQYFGYRLGKILGVSKRQKYPLYLKSAVRQIDPGIVLMGNAAHTLHPIAGQGLNLGLRDLATLAEILIEAKSTQKNLNDFALLEQYVSYRKKDQSNIIRFTDNAARLFTAEFLEPLSGFAFASLNNLPFLKRRLVKQLFGYSANAAKLSHGMPAR